MTNLSPAAQAVASAYDDTPEKDTGNHRYLWLAAALRAAADQALPEPSDHLPEQSCRWYRLGVSAYRHNLLTIAAELEALPE
jgi:hypothetical protein